MWPTPKSELYLRYKLRSHFLCDGDAISRYIHRLLAAEIPFSFWEHKKISVVLSKYLPCLLVFTCPGGPALPPAFCRDVQMCSELEFTAKYSLLCADCPWRPIVDLPQGLAEVAQDHLGGLLSSLEELMGSGRADLPVPYHPLSPGWDELSCSLRNPWEM